MEDYQGKEGNNQNVVYLANPLSEDSATTDQSDQASESEKIKDLEERKKQVSLELDILKAEQELQRLKLFGDRATPEFKGTVELKEGAGAAEARVLASMSIKKAAETIKTKIISQLKPTTQSGPSEKRTLLLLDFEELNELMQGLRAYSWMETLKRKYEEQGIKPVEGQLESAGLMFSAGLQVLSMLRSDYTFGGLNMKANHSELLAALAGVLTEYKVLIRNSLYPLQAPKHIEKLFKKLDRLRKLADTAEDERQRVKKEIQGTTNSEKKAALQRRYDALVKLHEDYLAFLKWLNVTGTNDIYMAAAVASRVSDVVGAEGAILLVKLEHIAGSFYTKKNLLSGLGKAPFYHSGAAIVSYILLNASDLTVAGGDTVAIYGGFVQSGSIEKTVHKVLK